MQVNQNLKPWAVHNVTFNHQLLWFSPSAGANRGAQLYLLKRFVGFRFLILLAASWGLVGLRILHSGLIRHPHSSHSPCPDSRAGLQHLVAPEDS